jgi:hypothetical protein
MRVRERTRLACKDIREFMAELSDGSFEEGAWIAMELNEATDEMSDVVSEFIDWFVDISERWVAEGKAEEKAAAP